jgi:NADH-quinone oxidoreductase subunit N
MTLPFADLVTILPEIIVVLAACALLVLDPITPASKKDLLAWMSLGALVVCFFVTMGNMTERVYAFSELVIVDPYSSFWKLLLYVVSGLTILLSMTYLKEEAIDLAEYYGFILLSLVGMMVMVSGADLLTIYLGIELMSISLYVMVGFKRFEARSIEASAKYFILGAFSSGILLYGISLLYGIAGSTRLVEIAEAVNSRGLNDPLLLIAMTLLIVGFGFKVGRIPRGSDIGHSLYGSSIQSRQLCGVCSRVIGRIWWGKTQLEWVDLRHVYSDHHSWESRGCSPNQCEADVSLFKHCPCRVCVNRIGGCWLGGD